MMYLARNIVNCKKVFCIFSSNENLRRISSDLHLCCFVKFAELLFYIEEVVLILGTAMLLICACVKFTSSGEIKLLLDKRGNGIEAVMLNNEHQIPVFEVCYLLFSLSILHTFQITGSNIKLTLSVITTLVVQQLSNLRIRLDTLLLVSTKECSKYFKNNERVDKFGSSYKKVVLKKLIIIADFIQGSRYLLVFLLIGDTVSLTDSSKRNERMVWL